MATSPLGLLEIGTVLQGKVHASFTKTFMAGGGLPPYHYQLDTGAGFPPQGIILDTNGVLSGTPSVSGDYTFGVCVTDTAGKSDCERWDMTITPAAALTITGSDNLNGTVGDNLNESFDAQGGVAPYQFSVGPNSVLPDGLALDTDGCYPERPAPRGRRTSMCAPEILPEQMAVSP